MMSKPFLKSDRVRQWGIRPVSARGQIPSVFLILFVFLASAGATSGQEQIPPDAEPPPLKMLSKKEKKQLESETRIKKRTKLALELMDARLLRAESANEKNAFQEVFVELGRFHAIIDHTLNFLNRKNNDSRKILNNFKRLEIGLRKFLPRIELIRREVPPSHQYYVKKLIKDVREARSRAVEPLFDDTVISEDDSGNR